jgi:hypothetical protein
MPMGLPRRLAALTVAVSRTLDELSTDSLRRWRERYADALSVPASVAENGAGSGTGGSGAGR